LLITVRPTPIARRIVAVTRSADAARPSIRVLVAALAAQSHRQLDAET
jgi:hypothetical protein